MSLPYSISKSVYWGNGVATRFSFYFRVWDTSHITVRVVSPKGEERLALGWTATLSENGGTVTYLHEDAPLPTGWKLVILRDMPFVQGVNLITGTRFDPQVIEDALDQATAERQQLLEGMSRAVMVEPGSDVLPANLIGDLRTASNTAVSAATDALATLADTQAVRVQTLADATSAAQSATQAAQSAQGVEDALAGAGTGAVTLRASRTTIGEWHITGLTPHKPLFILFSTTNTAASTALLSVQSGAYGGTHPALYYRLGQPGSGTDYSTNVFVCIPTGSTVVMNVPTLSASSTLDAVQ